MGRRILGFNDLIFHENSYWLSSSSWNGLYQFNSRNQKISYINEFPGEELCQENLYMRSGLYKNKIIFAPSSAKKVAIYDIDLNKFVMLEILHPDIQGKFHDVVMHEKYAFLIGHRYPAIVKVDMEDYKIQYFDKWLNELQYMSGINIPGFVLAERIEENIIWIPHFFSNIIMEFNLDTSFYKFIQLEEIKSAITGFAIDKSYRFIFSNKIIYMLNTENIIIDKIEIEKENEGIFCSIVHNKGDIWLFPIGNVGYGKAIYVNLDMTQNESILFSNTENGYATFGCVRRIENKIYLFMKQTTTIIVYDIISREQKEYKLDFIKDVPDNDMVIEDWKENLKTFIKYISNNREDCLEEEQVNCGKIIFYKLS